MHNNKSRSATIILSFLFPLQVISQIAAGGDYALNQTVTAGGGGSATGENYGAEETVGQPIAGTISHGGDYSILGGFWTPPQFAPTAAHVPVTGRVVIGTRGIGGAILTLSGGGVATPKSAITSSFGYFTFPGVEVGHFYVLSVRHKTYYFLQDTQTFMLVDKGPDIVFEAGGKN